MNGANALVGMSVVCQKGIVAGSKVGDQKHHVDSLNWTPVLTSDINPCPCPCP